MDINITLLGQMLTFGVLILVIYRHILPALRSAIEERQRIIDEGIAAGKLGRQNLRKAAELIDDRMAAAQKHASLVIEQARVTSGEIIENARSESEKMRSEYLLAAKKEMEHQIQLARQDLVAEDGKRVVSILQRLLSSEDGQRQLAAVNEKLIESSVHQI